MAAHLKIIIFQFESENELCIKHFITLYLIYRKLGALSLCLYFSPFAVLLLFEKFKNANIKLKVTLLYLISNYSSNLIYSICILLSYRQFVLSVLETNW